MNVSIPRPDAVLFDLDGTLADTLLDIMETLNATYAEVGLPAVTDPGTVRGWVGHGARSLIANSLGLATDTPRVEDLLAHFRRLYPGLAGRHARLYPGTEALLDALRERGMDLAVTTNKPRAATRATLDALGLGDRFGAVLTPDDVGERTKPDPAMLREAARRLGVPVTRCLLVGDGLADVQGAQACGMPVAAVLGGYCAVEVLKAAGADWYLEHLAELEGLLA